MRTFGCARGLVGVQGRRRGVEPGAVVRRRRVGGRVHAGQRDAGSERLLASAVHALDICHERRWTK